jgi:hypothetical protein
MAQTEGENDFTNQVRALREALEESRHVLDHVCEYHDDWLDEDLREIIQEANKEIDKVWKSVIDLINQSPPANEYLFERAGLLGAQSAAKVKGIKKSAKEFFRHPTKRAFMRAAKWINILLGSLVSIFPAGEALKEFKETIEAAITEE